MTRTPLELPRRRRPAAPVDYAARECHASVCRILDSRATDPSPYLRRVTYLGSFWALAVQFDVPRDARLLQALGVGGAVSGELVDAVLHRPRMVRVCHHELIVAQQR